MAPRTSARKPRTLLVTTSIAPPTNVPYLLLTDPARRLIATRGALYRWVERPLVDQIVICDSTGHFPLTKQDVRLFAEAGTKVEQLAFRQDHQLIRERGKGYGEGLIIQHAMKHSELLRSSPSFFKITGKLFCKNFEDMCRSIEQREADSMFWRLPVPRPLVDTRFFYCSKRMYLRGVSVAYRFADDLAGRICESTVRVVMSRLCRRGRSIAPAISGLQGGDDTMSHEGGGPSQPIVPVYFSSGTRR